MAQFCSVMDTRGPGGPIFSNRGGLRGVEGRGQVLIGRNIRSLVISSLWDWARGQNIANEYFCFGFAAQRQQSVESRVKLPSSLNQTLQTSRHMYTRH